MSEGLVRQTSRALVWNTVLLPLTAAITLLGSMVVVRSLSVETYATFAVAVALATTVLGYGDLGISAGMSRFLPEVISRGGRQSTVRVLRDVLVVRLAAFSVAVLILVLTSAMWMRLLHLPAGRVELIAYIAALVLLEAGGTTGMYFLIARFRLDLVNLVLLVQAGLHVLLFTLSAAAGWGLQGMLLALAAGSAVKLIMMGIGVRHELGQIPGRGRERDNGWRRFAKVSLSAYVEKLAASLHGPPFLTLLLAATAPTTDVAAFALAGSIVVSALSLVLSPTNGIILPAFAVAFDRGEVDKRRAFAYSIRLLTLLVCSALVILFAVAPDLVRLLYSSRYTLAGTILRILLIFYFLEYSVYAPANAALLTGGRFREYLLVKCLSVLFVPVYVLMLAPVGIVAVAVTNGVVRLGIAAALLLLAMKTQGLSYPWRALRTVAAAGAVGLGLLGLEPLWPQYAVLRISIMLVVGIVGMYTLLRVLHTFDDEDRRLILASGLPMSRILVRMM